MEGSLSPSYGEEKRKNEGPSSSPSSAFEKLQDSDMLINTRLKSKHRDAYPPPPFCCKSSNLVANLEMLFNSLSTTDLRFPVYASNCLLRPLRRLSDHEH